MEQNEGWRPIDTAPEGGERALFFAPGNPKAINQNAREDQIRVDRRVERYGWKHARQLPESPYTHWHPLPPPPDQPK